MSSNHEKFLRQAVNLAKDNKARGGRPFGAVLAVGGESIAIGVNNIVHSNDPTTHAEMEAIRVASQKLGRPNLKGSVIYASGHPCPMCLAAMLLTGVDEVYYAFDNNDAAPYGLSSEAVYQKLGVTLQPQPLPLTRLDVGVTAAQLYGGEA
jgi:tRNA(Arg) A34 adenosine deaminase TadA